MQGFVRSFARHTGVAEFFETARDALNKQAPSACAQPTRYGRWRYLRSRASGPGGMFLPAAGEGFPLDGGWCLGSDAVPREYGEFLVSWEPISVLP